MNLRVLLHHELVPADHEVYRVQAREGLAQLFHVIVEFTSQDPNLDIDGYLGTAALIELYDVERGVDEERRFFAGVVHRAMYLRELGEGLFLYGIELRPQVARLAHVVRSKIFQDQRLVDVVDAVLTDHKIDHRSNLSEHPTRSNTVQYAESDLSFLLRILEEAAIPFWFEHSADGHVLVWSQDQKDFTPIAGVSTFAIDEPPDQDTAECEPLFSVEMRCRQTHDAFIHRDFNFLTPEQPLEGSDRVSEVSIHERYEYPGRFETEAEAKALAKSRLFEARQERYTLHAVAQCHRLAPARIFQIVRGNPSLFLGDYFVESLDHDWRSERCCREETGDQTASASYRVQVIARSTSVNYRPPRRTPKPQVAGQDTAIVMAPEGEEIHVDSWGRIKARFYWDRESAFDDTASNWVRVQQPNLERTLVLPRAGWEMSIRYENGDPDRPIAMQKIYAGEQKPTYPLPDELHRSTLKTQSTPGGDGFNEIRLDDKKGAQELFWHAQRNLDVIVGHDRVETVGRSAYRGVNCNDIVSVGKSETYGIGVNQTIVIKGKSVEEVAKNRRIDVGNDIVSVKNIHTTNVLGDRSETIDGMLFALAERVDETFNANHTATILGAEAHVVALEAYVEAVAGNKIETTGGAKVQMTKASKAENIGGGKVLTAGKFELKAKDLVFSGKKEINLKSAGPYVTECKGDFTISAEKIAFDIKDKAEIVVGKNGLVADKKSVSAQGSKVATSGVKVLLKGKVDYKKPKKKSAGKVQGSVKLTGEKISEKVHKLAKKIMDLAGVSEDSQLRNRVHRKICTVTGHPIDVASGKMFTEQVDFEIPGPLPLRWERVYFTTSSYEGPLGRGWHHGYDAALVIGDDAIVLRTGDGRHVLFDWIDLGEESFLVQDGLTLGRDDGGYYVRDKELLVHRFGGVRGRELLLKSLSDRYGNRLAFRYGDAGQLVEIVDSGGRKFEVVSDANGRIECVRAPHPDRENDTFEIVRYHYDREGRLVEAEDALQHSQRYEYAGPLLVRETNRNGFSFHFEYDGSDETARCIHTWGDGGIYNHKVSYHRAHDDSLYTIVENSLGYKTTHHHDGAVVHMVVDALGNARTTEYDENYNVVSEANEEGESTSYEYDERGNKTAIVSSGGSRIEFQYDEGDQPVTAMDALGGKFEWTYDSQGRLCSHTDPSGAVTEYGYHGGRLSSQRGPGGFRATLEYDDRGAIVSKREFGVATGAWRYDGLGRWIAAVDQDGVGYERRLDICGRPIEIRCTDGRREEMSYDPEGAIRSRGSCRFEYDSAGHLTAVEEEGGKVEFAYDLESRLVSLTNRARERWTFEYDGCGAVIKEVTFAGRTRILERDPAGRVSRIVRGSGRTTTYEYDADGRIARVSHSDGSFVTASYRADGSLVELENEHSRLHLERDAMGRVVREQSDQGWVARQYDEVGRRSSIRSSRGLSASLTPRKNGGIGAISVSQIGEIQFEYDTKGREIARRWQQTSIEMERGPTGLPRKQEISAAGELVRRFEFSWEAGPRLRGLEEENHGRTAFWYDSEGRLIRSAEPGGSVCIRALDAVANVYRTEDRSDRTFAAEGQLLESRTEKGWLRPEYDQDGFLISLLDSGGVTHYRWTDGGQLAEIDRADGTRISFTYDPLGRRLTKRAGGRVTRWIWDGYVPLHQWECGETGEEGGEQLEPSTWLFEPGTFSPMMKISGDRAYLFANDHLGVPHVLLDSTGREVWSGRMNIYGRFHELTDRDREIQPFRFPGQFEDVETGLHYNLHRYYDPSLDQYLTPDPIGLEGGIYLRSYVLDPLTSSDPHGLAGTPYVPRNVSGNPVPLARGVTSQGVDIPLPDPNAAGPHTVLGGKVSKDGVEYRQAATFPAETWPKAYVDVGGRKQATDVPLMEIHFHDHNRPDHPPVHMHEFEFADGGWRRVVRRDKDGEVLPNRPLPYCS